MKKLALFFVLCFCACFIAGCNGQSATITTDKIVYQNWGSVVTEENKKSVTDEINKDNTTKMVVIELLIDSPNTIFETTVTDKTNIDAIRQELHDFRQGIKNYYSQENEKLVKELKIDEIGMEMNISGYTPFIFLKQDNISDSVFKSIVKLSNSEKVNKIYILDKQQEMAGAVGSITNEFLHFDDFFN
ncbi:MAG: hypothetical protein IJF75_03270 [Clostridia bacterium]|nr:hypothetical protein [Clostridia bacterium]